MPSRQSRKVRGASAQTPSQRQPGGSEAPSLAPGPVQGSLLQAQLQAQSPSGGSDQAGPHIVRRGESLSSIARDVLGDAGRWRELYGLNEDVVGPDPNRVGVGTRLMLPSSSGSSNTAGPSCSAEDRPTVSGGNPVAEWVRGLLEGVSHLLAGDEEDVRPPLPASVPAYPGKAGSTKEKHDFYVRLLDLTGHGSSVPQKPGERILVAIRGFTPETLELLSYSNDPSKFNDMFVVLGKTPAGELMASEYVGSVDPGVAGTHALESGEYDYEYEGESFTSLNGFTVDGSYFRMTKDSQKEFQVTHDANGDNVYDDESGNRTIVEKDNRYYLIHFGGDNAEGSVGGWSIGCQVIPGRDESGTKNVDKLAGELGKESFKEIILDGREVEAKLKAQLTT